MFQAGALTLAALATLAYKAESANLDRAMADGNQVYVSNDRPEMCGDIDISHLDTSPLHTEGRYIKNEKDETVRINGISVYGGLQQPNYDEEFVKERVDAQIIAGAKYWNAKWIRLQLSQDLWRQDPARFTAELDRQVKLITSLNTGVILNNQNEFTDFNTSAPTDLSIDFIKFLQKRYGCLGGKEIVDVFNETRFHMPGKNNLTYSQAYLDLWLKGGNYHGKRFVGQQALVNAAESISDNLVEVEGLGVATTFQGVKPNTVSDPKHKVVFALHHPHISDQGVQNWGPAFLDLAEKKPVVLGEYQYYPANRQECLKNPGGYRNIPKLIWLWKQLDGVVFWGLQPNVMVRWRYPTAITDEVVDFGPQRAEGLNAPGTMLPANPGPDFCQKDRGGIGAYEKEYLAEEAIHNPSTSTTRQSVSFTRP